MWEVPLLLLKLTIPLPVGVGCKESAGTTYFPKSMSLTYLLAVGGVLQAWQLEEAPLVVAGGLLLSWEVPVRLLRLTVPMPVAALQHLCPGPHLCPVEGLLGAAVLHLLPAADQEAAAMAWALQTSNKYVQVR